MNNRFRAKIYYLNPNKIEAIIDNKNDDELTVFREVLDMLNSLNDENEQLKKENQRLYNYFEDWYSDMISANAFSEMWDYVKEDEKWD